MNQRVYVTFGKRIDENPKRSIEVPSEGFEPLYDGIKIQCLTAWLHPNNFLVSILKI